MKKLIVLSVFLCVFCGSGFAQNLTTISASNITDINGAKLAAGQLCFLITDQQDNPISVSIGGGGQALKRGYCSPVTSGAVTSFTVPNPAATLPSGIYYRITVKDSATGQEVLRYTNVAFSGATFNFDNYAPLNLGSFAPLTGNSVSGNLAVSGNIAATGTVTGSNIPGAIPGVGSCTNQFVRILNSAAAPTCSTVGSLDLASSLALTTPNIGAATGTSVNLSGNATVGGTLGVTGTSTMGNMNLGPANTLGVANIKQVSATSSFNISDNLGISHFFISNSSPYTNTFVQGNGSGSVFLGSANKAFVADATGAIITAGGITLQTSAQTLPASIMNDTAGGITFTNNAGSSIQFGNGGTLFLNSPQGIRWTGATSGTTFVQASPIAGSGILTLPATVTDTLVARTTTDTLTNKTLTSPALTSPVINSGISQGTGVKHQRFGASCTTAAAIGAACNTTYTWTNSFADANYSVVCTGDGRAGGALGVPVVINTNSTGASSFLVSIAAFTAAAAQFPAVDCIAFHD
ncbi:MAG TPA: hypothetical protein VHV32_17315 [Candidatus Angelobacter sp.]|nr:hypothetical protein [Candidatus Angelobacter sp.]